MPRILIHDDSPGRRSGDALARRVADRPGREWSVESAGVAAWPGASVDALVYLPRLGRGGPEDLPGAEALLGSAVRAGVGHIVLMSSAAVYGARPHNVGFLSESRPRTHSGRNAIVRRWIALEELAERCAGGQPRSRLAILRPPATPAREGGDYFSRLLRKRVAFTLAGHDPSLQFLSPDDLAGAVARVVEKRAEGIYNVAPEGVVPLRAALRLAGVRRVPLPRWTHSLVRGALSPLGLAHPADQLDYVRYSWTVSGRRLAQELGFAPERSSVGALREFLGLPPDPGQQSEFDGHGMDRKYIAAYGRTLLRFLHDVYWRIELNGLEHIPRQGRAVLVGVHRGFMPLDAVMALHGIVSRTGRHPRFLIHPTLIKFPFQFNFMTKLGGMIACQENADCVLGRDELLGIYPEGIHGAFRYFRGVYRLGKFGRDEFVRMALRNRAPIVPFVNVGSAEIFPVLAKIDWGWWKRFSLWPCFPIAPPFPLLPVPLPSKWHTRFLEPMHVEQTYPPEAADDLPTVRAISQEVRNRMQEAIDDLLRRRRSVFRGSIFGKAKDG